MNVDTLRSIHVRLQVIQSALSARDVTVKTGSSRSSDAIVFVIHLLQQTAFLFYDKKQVNGLNEPYYP
jgi:hypothetical protein